MLLDFVRPVYVYEVGFFKILARGGMLAGLCGLLLNIAYSDENPTSFVYLTFAGLIFANKLRLRPNSIFQREIIQPENATALEVKIRDNEELFTTGYVGRVFYLLFAVVMTIIFGCSLAYSKLQNESDIYPFFQIKPEETKTKNLLVVLILSWAVCVGELFCGRSYHWSELSVYEHCNIQTLNTVIDYAMIYLIFTFSNQLKFSIFSLIFFFFVLATITAFLFSLLRGDKAARLSFDGYINFLKWLTFAGVVVIYSKKSYKKFIDLLSQTWISNSSFRDQYLKDLIDQFIDKEENFDRILILFVLSSLRLYFSDIIQITDSIKAVIEKPPVVSEKSYFVSYFAQNILALMHHRGSDIINYNGSYKLSYFHQLEKVESVKTKFISIFSKVKIKLTFWQKYLIASKKFLQGIISIAMNIITNHTLIIFQIVLAYIIIKNTQYMLIMILPIIWCMLSFVSFGPVFATSMTVFFLYIPSVVALLHLLASNILCRKNGVIYRILGLDGYCNFVSTYPIFSENSSVPSEDQKTQLFVLLILTIVYLLLLIEQKKNLKLVVTSNLINRIGQMAVAVKSKLYEDLTMLVRFIVSELFSNFYYICLVFLFLGIIQTISIFNLIFIGFFFYFILNADKAKKYWLLLLLYLQFLLIIRFLYSLKIFTFSLDRETSAMIGFYFGIGTPTEEKSAMWSYWTVLVAISIQYQLFHTKLAQQYRYVDLKFKSAWLEHMRHMGVELRNSINMIYLNSIIWLFHFALVLILVYSERTIFNVILMIMEGIFFAIHLHASRQASTLELRRKVNKYWTMLIITILVFAFLFYIFLFCKYTVIRRLVTGLFGLDPNQTESSSTLLNPRVASEFTMLYLLKQRTLQIEEKSFIRENLKVLLAFLSFFKIFHEKKSIETDEVKQQEQADELKEIVEGDDTITGDDTSALISMGKREQIVKPRAKQQKTTSGEDENRFTKVRETLDQIIVYMSHLMKSIILFVIIVWNLEGPNIFKIIILFAMLVTFYRYLSSTTTLMVKSRLIEVLEKSRIY